MYMYLYEDEPYEDKRKLLIKTPFDVYGGDAAIHETIGLSISIENMQ